MYEIKNFIKINIIVLIFSIKKKIMREKYHDS